jgi:hypothetical protein
LYEIQVAAADCASCGVRAVVLTTANAEVGPTWPGHVIFSARDRGSHADLKPAAGAGENAGPEIQDGEKQAFAHFGRRIGNSTADRISICTRVVKNKAQIMNPVRGFRAAHQSSGLNDAALELRVQGPGQQDHWLSFRVYAHNVHIHEV